MPSRDRGLTLAQYIGHSRVIQAKKEVILSAGAVGSPVILLHSGIGDEQELKSLGIKPLVNLPSVGKNLTDHPLFGIGFRANTTDTVDKYVAYIVYMCSMFPDTNITRVVSITKNATLFAEVFDQWRRERKGPMTNSVSNNIMWLRLSGDSPVFKSHSDPSAGPGAPHWELAMSVRPQICSEEKLVALK